jgi:uncharacterized protein (TIGR00297 family)
MISQYLASIVATWWTTTPTRFGVAVGVTVAFSIAGRLIRGVSGSGAIAGGVICFLLLACAGPGAFLALFSLFVVTWIATRLGRQRKQNLGTAERREGRTAEQVLANLSVAAVCAVVYATRGDALWILAMVAALTEAAADTVSSECGQAFSQTARLITTLEPVAAGTDGGISVVGTTFGLLGALVVATISMVCGLIPARWLALCAAAGVIGMLADSVLGAWLERRGWLKNDHVNLAGTVVAAVLGAGLGRVLAR